MRIAYLDCFSGISGDMLLGAMVDAGVPVSAFAETAAALNVGARIEARKVVRGGLTATKVDVLTEESGAAKHAHGPEQPQTHSHEHSHGPGQSHTHTHEHTHLHEDSHEHSPLHAHDDAHTHEHHRSLSTILGIISSAHLGEEIKQRASRAFKLLGEAEAGIHSIPLEQVHFHEVGAVDTIVDIVCAAAGAAVLGVDRWMASPLNVGSGTVQCAHGTLP